MSKATPGRISWGKGRRSQSGFTLIELLVVLVILSLLATVAVPQVLKYLGGAKTDAAKVQIQSLATNLDLYRLDTGRYPSQQEGLGALVERPASTEKWNGPYVTKREMLLDPWGRPYVYRQPGQHGAYDLYTLGADNAPGGEGEDQDVTNW
jgi:general secretion pathway protein G